MSHNLYTINNDGADVASYHGSNQGVIYIGRGETQTYAGNLNPTTSPYWSTTKFEFYDSNPINTISGASFNKRAGTNWIQSITLPAGTYEMRCSCLAPTYSTNAGNIALKFFVFSSTSNVPPTQNGISDGIFSMSPTYADQNYQYTRSDCSVFTLASSEDVFFLIGQVSISGAYSTTISDDRISETAYVFIRKLK